MKIILVEGTTDAPIIEHLLKKEHVSSSQSIDVRPMKGCDDLAKLLKDIYTDMQQNNDEAIRIGIILDKDNKTTPQRLEKVNKDLKLAMPDITGDDLSEENLLFQFRTSKIDHFKIACHFLPFGKNGEIEDLLLSVISADSTHANLLESEWWTAVRAAKPIRSLSEKDFKKLKIDFYKRYDLLTREQREYAGKNMGWTKFFENHPNAFDFNSDIAEMNALRDFLSLFQSC